MASMRITERRVGDVAVLELDGRLTLEDGEIPLRDAVDRVVAQGCVRIVLEMGQVSAVDSAGIGMLVCKYLTAFRKGGNLKLLHLTSRADHLLHLTRLYAVFEIFDSEREAIQSFGTQPPAT